MEEVVALEELVGKFGEGKAVAGLTVEALLHAVLGHHVVDGDVLADLAGEVEEGEVLHPVVVVHEFGRVGRVGVEVEEVRKLLLDTFHVVAEHIFGEEVALGTLARGVANHARGAAHEGEGLVARALEVAEHHHGAEVSDMEGIGGGVDAHVSGNHLLAQQLFSAGHHLVEHTAPCQFFNKVHRFL